jgi:hypothetical protein
MIFATDLDSPHARAFIHRGRQRATRDRIDQVRDGPINIATARSTPRIAVLTEIPQADEHCPFRATIFVTRVLRQALFPPWRPSANKRGRCPIRDAIDLSSPDHVA